MWPFVKIFDRFLLTADAAESVCFHSNFLTAWLLTLTVCMYYDCSSLWIKNQGHRSRSRVTIRQGPSEMFQSMSWFSGGNTKIVGVGGPGVFTWYYTRIGSMNFNFRGPFGGGTPGAPKSKIKILAHFVVLPKNPQHNILNIAWTIEELNLNLKKKFWDGGTIIHGGAEIT